MNVYIYQAALVCEDCGDKIKAKLAAEGKAPADPSDEGTWDSNNYPKGPERKGGGEADTPQHCDVCNVFLENPLTEEGIAYVKEVVRERYEGKRPHSNGDVINEWRVFYEIRHPEDEKRGGVMSTPKITAYMMTSNGRRRSFRIGEFTVMVEPHEDDKAQAEFTRKLAEAAARICTCRDDGEDQDCQVHDYPPECKNQECKP